MSDNKTQNSTFTNEQIIAFTICSVIGFFYIQNTIPYNHIHYSMSGICWLAFFSTMGGSQLAFVSIVLGVQIKNKEKSVILCSLIIFLACLACFHFLIFPNSDLNRIK